MSGQRHLATGLACGGASPLDGLRRNYVIISDEERAGAQEPSPAEIVAALHRRIAAQSPEHAELVARFEERQQAHPGWSAGRDARLQEYARLRRQGMSKKDAREQVGVSRSTGLRYEADMRLVATEPAP